MFDQERDETFMSAERRAVNAERGGFGVFASFVNKAKTFRDREIDLVGRDGKSRPATLQTWTSILGP